MVRFPQGAIAQLGERVNGIHEVGSSILLAPPISLVSYAGARVNVAWLARDTQGLDRTFEFNDFSEAFGFISRELASSC